jgi:hypothetical protein
MASLKGNKVSGGGDIFDGFRCGTTVKIRNSPLVKFSSEIGRF